MIQSDGSCAGQLNQNKKKNVLYKIFYGSINSHEESETTIVCP